MCAWHTAPLATVSTVHTVNAQPARPVSHRSSRPFSSSHCHRVLTMQIGVLCVPSSTQRVSIGEWQLTHVGVVCGTRPGESEKAARSPRTRQRQALSLIVRPTMDPLHGEPANRQLQLLFRVILWSLAIKKPDGSSQAAARDHQLQEPTGTPAEGGPP